jgi:outer membrane protein assembly factor BamB
MLACALGLIVAMAGSVRGDDWPQFRGPTGMGICQEKGLPTSWDSSGKNIVWKMPLPSAAAGVKSDHNQSSPIVVAGQVVVTLSWWPEGVAQQEFPEHHVVCWSAESGKLLWDTTVPHGKWKLSDLRGGYTAPTPAADGKQLYVLFGSGILAAMDFDGRLVWQQVLADPEAFDVAIGTSPRLFEGTVLVESDKNGSKSSLVAYDADTGDVRWEKKRPEAGFAHSTPTLVEIGGKRQLLTAGSNALQGVDPHNGEVLWSFPFKGDACSPAFNGSVIYCDSGRGSKGVAIGPPGVGGRTEPEKLWEGPQIPEALSSPVFSGAFLYRLHNPSVVKCIRVADGSLAYAERLDGAQPASSPIVTPEGRIYFASGGKSYIVATGEKYDLLSTCDLGDPSMASPAVSNGRIFIKGHRALYCIGEAKP